MNVALITVLVGIYTIWNFENARYDNSALGKLLTQRKNTLEGSAEVSASEDVQMEDLAEMFAKTSL